MKFESGNCVKLLWKALFEQRKKIAWLRNLLLLPNLGIRSPLGGCSEIVH